MTKCPKCKKGVLSTNFDVPDKTRIANRKAGFVVQKCYGVVANNVFMTLDPKTGCGYTEETPLKKPAA